MFLITNNNSCTGQLIDIASVTHTATKTDVFTSFGYVEL